MINQLKESWHVVYDAFINQPLVVMASTLGLLMCIGLAFLTVYLVQKFDFLALPFFILIMILLSEFYIDILIWIINQVK